MGPAEVRPLPRLAPLAQDGPQSAHRINPKKGSHSATSILQVRQVDSHRQRNNSSGWDQAQFCRGLGLFYFTGFLASKRSAPK
jgi:hypothetical protein